MINGLPLGLALATGVNTYLPLFILALFARLDSAQVHLSPPFRFLTSEAAGFISGQVLRVDGGVQPWPA